LETQVPDFSPPWVSALGNTQWKATNILLALSYFCLRMLVGGSCDIRSIFCSTIHGMLDKTMIETSERCDIISLGL